MCRTSKITSVPSDEDVSGCGLRDLDPLVRGLSLIVCCLGPSSCSLRGMEVGTEATEFGHLPLLEVKPFPCGQQLADLNRLLDWLWSSCPVSTARLETRTKESTVRVSRTVCL